MAKKQLTPPPKPTDQKGAQPAAPVEQSPSPEPGSLAESRQPEAIPALETPQLSPVPQPPSSQSAPASAEPASVAPEARTPRTAPAQVEAEQKSATPTRRPAEPILPPQALPVAEVKPTAMSGPVVDPKFPHAARPDVPATPAQPEQVPAGAPAAERAAEPARPTPIVQSKSDTAQAIIAQTPPIAPAKAAAPGATAIESETPAARPASGSGVSFGTSSKQKHVVLGANFAPTTHGSNHPRGIPPKPASLTATGKNAYSDQGQAPNNGSVPSYDRALGRLSPLSVW